MKERHPNEETTVLFAIRCIVQPVSESTLVVTRISILPKMASEVLVLLEYTLCIRNIRCILKASIRHTRVKQNTHAETTYFLNYPADFGSNRHVRFVQDEEKS